MMDVEEVGLVRIKGLLASFNTASRCCVFGRDASFCFSMRVWAQVKGHLALFFKERERESNNDFVTGRWILEAIFLHGW